MYHHYPLSICWYYNTDLNNYICIIHMKLYNTILHFIELDDGNILTGKPYIFFDGKFTMGFRCRFSLKPIQWTLTIPYLWYVCVRWRTQMAGEHGHPLLLGATAGESLGKPLKLGVETWKPCGNHVETMWKPCGKWCSGENQLCLWPFSIAVCIFTRIWMFGFKDDTDVCDFEDL